MKRPTTHFTILLLSICLSTILLCIVFSPLASAAPDDPFTPLGEQKVLVIPVKHFCKEPPDPKDPCPADVAAVLGPPRNKADALETILNSRVNLYYNRATYGQTSFKFTVLKNSSSADGWWTSPYTEQQYVKWFTPVDKGGEGGGNFKGEKAPVRVAVEDIADKNTDLTPYRRIVVVDNLHRRGGQANCAGCPEYYQTKAGKKPFTANVLSENVSDDAMTTILCHELGHQLGLPDLYTVGFPGCSPTTGGCPNSDNFGPWDLMAHDCFFNHFASWSKVNRGWIAKGYITTIGPPDPDPISKTVILGALEGVSNNVIQIPITTGPPFYGYYAECRRKIKGDENIPEEGLLISLVDEAPKSSLPFGVVSRVVRTTDPVDSCVEALQPGEAFVDSKRGIAIRYLEKAIEACTVRVEYFPSARYPDLAITQLKDFKSPDIWIDSEMNGFDVYPKSQPVDSDGVPSGPGDSAWRDHDNRIGFRIRNSGAGPAANIKVEVYVTQPITIETRCGPEEGDAELIGTVTIPFLMPGAVYKGFVKWQPKTSDHAQIGVRIVPVADELSYSNNVAEKNLHSFFPPLISFPFTTEVVVKHSPLCDRMAKVIPFPPDKLPPPPDPGDPWDVRLSPEFFTLEPGKRQTVTLTITPPRSVRPGAAGDFPIGLALESGDTFVTFGGVNIVSAVREAAITSCEVQAQSSTLGAAVSVSGTIRPTHTDSPVALEYRGPDGRRATRVLVTNALGIYRDTFPPAQLGQWTVQAFWQGDEDHESAISAARPFSVVCTPPTLDPIPSPVQVKAGNIGTLALSVAGVRPPCNQFTFSVLPPSPQIPVPPFVRLSDNGDGTAILRLAPGPNDIGTYVVIVRVSDRSSPPQSASQTITIMVTP